MCLDCGCLQPGNDHGDGRHITYADLAAAAGASGISPLEAAANIIATLQACGADVMKAAEQRFVLGIAYQAGPDPRIAKGADGGRDYFTKDELEKAAWSFLRNGPRGGLFHIDGTEGAIEFVESSIHRGPDWDLGDGLVVKDGDWIVGGILDDRAWQLYKAGKINGFSPQGVARRRRVRPAAA